MMFNDVLPGKWIMFDDELTASGEMEISIEGRYSDEAYAWVNVEHAKQIIEHLKKVFGIKEGEK